MLLQKAWGAVQLFVQRLLIACALESFSTKLWTRRIRNREKPSNFTNFSACSQQLWPISWNHPVYDTTCCMLAHTTYSGVSIETNRIRGRRREKMTQDLLPTHPSVYPSIWFAFVWMSLILQLLPQLTPVPLVPLPVCCMCQIRTETAEAPWTRCRNMLLPAGPGAEHHWDTLDQIEGWHTSGRNRTCCSVWDEWSDYWGDKES